MKARKILKRIFLNKCDGNKCHNDSDVWCRAPVPSKNGWMCSLKKGHKGNHIACIGGDPTNKELHNNFIWKR